MDKLKDLIQYIAEEFSNRFKVPELTRSRISKLVYLSDLKSFDELGHKITENEYLNYHYGPYSRRIREGIDSLARGNKIDYEIKGPVRHYCYENRDNSVEVDSLTKEEKKIIENVVGRHGGKRVSDLIEFTRSTRPYKESSMMDEISF